MANTRSAQKRIRSDAKKRARNQATLSELKTLSKKLGAMKDDPAKAREFSRRVISRFDSAVTRGVIPKARADRKKSRIEKFLARLEQAKAEK